jgi:hypothetical protein
MLKKLMTDRLKTILGVKSKQTDNYSIINYSDIFFPYRNGYARAFVFGEDAPSDTQFSNNGCLAQVFVVTVLGIQNLLAKQLAWRAVRK